MESFGRGGRYEILEPLGRGGTGSVFRARDLLEGREVALKVFRLPAPTRENAGEDEARLARREFRLLASQAHPHVVRVHDFGLAEDGRPYISMELLRGETFFEFARREGSRSGPFDSEVLASSEAFAEVLRQVLGALDYLHARGTLHLDLKPENIIVARDEVAAGGIPGEARLTAKLVDFGLAHAGGGSLTTLGGTAEYISPERIRGAPPDGRADLYSLGVILYEAFLGVCPFAASTPGELFRLHLEASVPGPERLPERYREGILRCLEKDASRRPVSAWKLLLEWFGDRYDPASAMPLFDAAFVGREEILERIELEAGAPAGGKTRAVLIAGGRGSGKSRVLLEAKARLQVLGVDVLLESGRGSSDRPGDLPRRLLRKARAILRDESAGARARDPEAEGPADLQGIGSAIDPAILESRRERALGAFRAGFQALAPRRPLAILIDDLDEADSLSRAGIVEFLLALEADPEAKTLFVLAVRDESWSGTPARTELEILRPGPLNAAEVEAYLAQVLGPSASGREAAERLAARTGGNVAFLEECVRLAVRTGRLRRVPEGWQWQGEADIEVPARVEEAVASRLAALDPASLRILRWAAVLGRPFRAEEAAALEARMGGSSRAAIEERLGELRLSQFLHEADGFHAIGGSVVAEIIDQGIEAAEKRRMHGAAAGELAARGASERRLEEYARHLFESEDPARSLEFLVRAGESARKVGAVKEAELQFSRALSLPLEPARRFVLLLARQDALGHLGRREEQLEAIGELDSLARSLGGADRRREVAVRAALHHEAMGRKREALEGLERALGDGALGDAERAVLRSRIGVLRVLLHDFDAAFADLRSAMDQATRAGDRRLAAECAQFMGLGHYLKGERPAALAGFGDALAFFRAEGEEHRVGALESNIGLVHLEEGSLEAAKERFQSSLKAFRRMGFRRGEAMNLANLGLVYIEMGRAERALDSLGEAIRIRRWMGDRRGEGADLGNLAEAWIRLGLAERARTLAEDALRIAREYSNTQSESANECRLASVDILRGDARAALSRLDRALALAVEAKLPAQEALVRSVRVRAALANEEAEHAVEEARRALALAESARLYRRVPSFRALLAAGLQASHRLDEADRESRRAVGELEALEAPTAGAAEVWYLRARVLRELREQVGRDGPPAAGRSPRPAEADCDEALRRAFVHLREEAEAIEDEELRRGYIEGVPVHREINRLHEILQARVRRDAVARERSFHEIARSIHDLVELDPLLDRLLALAIETTHGEKGLVALKNADSSFTVRAARGMERDSVDDATAICRSVIADVAAGGGPVLATDAGSDDRFRDRRSVISYRIRTLMCVPMVVREEIVGAVYVDGRGAASFELADLDYLVSFAQLAAMAVDNVRWIEKLRSENLNLRREVDGSPDFHDIVGRSPPMLRLARLIEKVAATAVNVLISGETGTGKELVAKALHRASGRRGAKFIAIDCGALPDTLLESELFGHKKGAFSGAVHDRLGLFEEADAGTLFLDEITNLSFDLQAKLLRVLQEGELRRVGENHVRKVDVRVVAASNVDVRSAVETGGFREDLFYRLNVITLEVPALRDRREDIPLLAHHFLEKISRRSGKPSPGLTEDAVRFLIAAPWRGNVRELENLIEKAVILAEGDRLDGAFLESLLPPTARPSQGEWQRARGTHGGVVVVAAPESETASGSRAPRGEAARTLAEFDEAWLAAERAYLEDLVKSSGGNLAEASRRAQVRNRNTLISRLKRHGIGKRKDGDGPVEGGSDPP